MIQIKAHADDAMEAKTSWQTVYTDTAKTCAGKVLTWDAKVETEDACKQACTSWGEVPVPGKPNTYLRCGAGYWFHKADGKAICRLFETCDKCKTVAVAGTTFTASEPCKAKCSGPICRKDDGFKRKPGFQQIECAGPDCSTDECCDPLRTTTEEPEETTEEPSVEPTDPPSPVGCSSGLPPLLSCQGHPGRNYFASCSAGHVCDREGCPSCPPGHHYCSNSQSRAWGHSTCPNTQHCTSKGCAEGVDPLLHLKEQCDCPVVSPPVCKAPLLQCQGVAGRNYFASCRAGQVCDASGCPHCPSGWHYCNGPHYFNQPLCPNDQHCTPQGCAPGAEDNLLDFELCDCPAH